jgi:hypothetical protein
LANSGFLVCRSLDLNAPMEKSAPYTNAPPHMKIPSKNQVVQWLATLCVGLLSSQGQAAPFVEISAQIELTAYRSDQTNAEAKAKTRVISVVCITGTNLWHIETDWPQNSANKWFFDGTNVYESIRLTKPMPQEMQDRMKKAMGIPAVPFETVKSNLTINLWPSPDGHPLGDDTVNLPWLAFCSGTYLKREGRPIPLPCDMLRHTPDRFAYSDRTEVFPDAFGLPRSIDLFLSRSRYLSSIEDFYKGWGSRYLDWMRHGVTNLQEGALTFHYLVTATTNFQSWTLPLRFEFYQEGRKFIQNGEWFKRGVGTLKSVREAAAPTPLFEPSLQQTIVDWRFQDEDTGMNANTYTWTNSSPPQPDDPALQARFKRRVEQARRHKEDGK